MIIEEVRLCNLFSYRGERVFDFRGLSPGRNVALVHGRNGYGKTSFLNALRLLFLGVTDELRAAVQVGRKPTVKQYVLGIANEWAGIFNRAARRAGETECSVNVLLREGNASIIANRSWRMVDADHYETWLRVQLPASGQSLEDEQAQQYLYRLMPRHLIPFFIYDGEQVQQLAEANREKQLEHIEHVLGLPARDLEIETLSTLIKMWRREGLPEPATWRLRQVERKIEELQDNLAGILAKIKETEDELSQTEEAIEHTERYLESLRAYAHEREVVYLRERMEEKKQALEACLRVLAEELPREAPLLTQPALVSQAEQTLRALVKDSTSEVALALQQILHGLPQRLFEEWPLPNPDLSTEQKRFLSQKLIDLLRPYTQPPVTGGGPLRLNRDEADRLLTVFASYANQLQEKRRRYADDLRKISELKRDLAELQRKLDDVSSLQEDERERYKQRKQQLQHLQEETLQLKDQLRELQRQRRECERELEETQKELDKQERELQASQQRKAKVEVAEKLRDFSQRYKERMKKYYRGAIEEAINRHYRALMTGHPLLARIAVADDYGLSYLDADGAPIGMATISAGMKQLVATALLWALREVSGAQAPVVIDTPLARIDRENQLNLITQYYPNAAAQVILLPTDSELDREKYALLEPYIYCQYRLDNPTGEDTLPVANAPMYEHSVV